MKDNGTVHKEEFCLMSCHLQTGLLYYACPKEDFYIKIIKKAGGTLGDSFIADGMILEKSIATGCERRVENPRVLIANTPMDHDKIKIMGSKVKVDSMTAIADIEAAEKAKMAAKVQKILEHRPDVFINRQLIYNYPEQLLADAGVMVIEHADFDGVERLSAILGSDILSTFDSPESATLGTCESIEEIMIGEDKVINLPIQSRKSQLCHRIRGYQIIKIKCYQGRLNTVSNG